MPSTDSKAEIERLLSAPGRLQISVIITTFNEEINIEDCIRSVLWADEILVVDSLSTDRTVERARRHPVKLLEREYFGSAAQKNWSMDRVENDWVLILDADERLTDDLALEILLLLVEGPQFYGYFLRRRNIVLGKVIRHSGWSTDKVIRFFHRNHGRYPDRRVHADLDIEGPTPVLRNALLHYTFRSLDQYWEKLRNYAEWGAAQGFREGRRAGVLALAGRPVWRFLRTYVVQFGFLDGLHGLVVCGLQAFGSFLKYARLWDFNVRSRAGEEIVLPAFDDNKTTWQRAVPVDESEDGEA